MTGETQGTLLPVTKRDGKGLKKEDSVCKGGRDGTSIATWRNSLGEVKKEGAIRGKTSRREARKRG